MAARRLASSFISAAPAVKASAANAAAKANDVKRSVMIVLPWVCNPTLLPGDAVFPGLLIRDLLLEDLQHGPANLRLLQGARNITFRGVERLEIGHVEIRQRRGFDAVAAIPEHVGNAWDLLAFVGRARTRKRLHGDIVGDG